jgi:hypothetical protein
MSKIQQLQDPKEFERAKRLSAGRWCEGQTLRLKGFSGGRDCLSRSLPNIARTFTLVRTDDGSYYTAKLSRAPTGAHGRSGGVSANPYRIDMQGILSIPTGTISKSMGLNESGHPRDVSRDNPTLKLCRDKPRFTKSDLPGDGTAPTILRYNSQLGTFGHQETLANIEGSVLAKIGESLQWGNPLEEGPIVATWKIDLSGLRPDSLARISGKNGEEVVLGPEDWVSYFH